MKVLVFAHQLEIGGTQTNAIELAAALRDVHGLDVVLFATPGPAVELAAQKGLRYVPAPDAFVHPSPARVRALRDTVKRERPDVIHAWDWWQYVDALYCEHLLKRIPLVVSDMSMTLTRVLPKFLPITFGTPELVDLARASGRHRAEVLLPPVDVRINVASAVDASHFRSEWRIGNQEITLVTVSRLSRYLKAESLRRTIHAVGVLGRDLPLRFLLIGDGEGRADLQRLATDTNDRLGRQAVVLTGPLIDPRPAYASADIVIGMGGSALRGMAFGKPVIVVGELGFSSRFGPETAESFHHKGMYGLGAGERDEHRLTQDLEMLANDRGRWLELGRFSRDFVIRHFALEKVGAQLAVILRSAVETPPRLPAASCDALRTAAVLVRERRIVSYRFRDWLKRQTVSEPSSALR